VTPHFTVAIGRRRRRVAGAAGAMRHAAAALLAVTTVLALPWALTSMLAAHDHQGVIYALA